VHVRPADPRDPSGGHDEARAAQLRQELVDWAKGKVASWDTPTEGLRTEGGLGLPSIGRGSPARSVFEAERSAESRQPLELTQLERSWAPPGDVSGDQSGQSPGGPAEVLPQTSAGRSAPALQVHNRYLVAETEEGVTIIDQHALHERILYEQLRSRVMSGAIETQNLLVPEPVDLSAAEAATALEHRELLGQLGMKIEPFGGDTVLVAGYPAMLANLSPVELLRELLERLLSGGRAPDRRDLLDELLHAIACKAAIKAGDRLAPEEIAALLEQRHLVDDPHHCPHGRPAALVFTREELDRQFKRG
jgi:DNA mismatch repair protein MutL